jgi:hypothetical protein
MLELDLLGPLLLLLLCWMPAAAVPGSGTCTDDGKAVNEATAAASPLDRRCSQPLLRKKLVRACHCCSKSSRHVLETLSLGRIRDAFIACVSALKAWLVRLLDMAELLLLGAHERQDRTAGKL